MNIDRLNYIIAQENRNRELLQHQKAMEVGAVLRSLNMSDEELCRYQNRVAVIGLRFSHLMERKPKAPRLIR